MNKLTKKSYNRICGQLDGNMEDMLPCLFIGKFGVGRERDARMNKSLAGIFVIGVPAGNGACPFSGLIIPLNRIHDEILRETLQNLAQFLRNEPYQDDCTSRIEEAQRTLNSKLDDCLTIDKSHNTLTNMIHFDWKKSKGLYKLLAGQSDYVVNINEKSEGKSIATDFSPFVWNNFFEFTEWFNDALGEKRWGPEFPYPSLVFRNAAALAQFCKPSESDLYVPALVPSACFSIRSDVKDQPVTVKMHQEEYGWANIELTVGESARIIDLSNVFPPFGQLLEWIKLVSVGNLPVQLEIDEEGVNTCLTAYQTESPERMYFVVHDKYDVTNVTIQAIINRKELVLAFKNELRRFFADEFDGTKWDTDDRDASPLLLRMKDDVWLNENLHHAHMEELSPSPENNKISSVKLLVNL